MPLEPPNQTNSIMDVVNYKMLIRIISNFLDKKKNQNNKVNNKKMVVEYSVAEVRNLSTQNGVRAGRLNITLYLFDSFFLQDYSCQFHLDNSDLMARIIFLILTPS